MLPQAWFDQFFERFRHIRKPRLLRRVVSIHLAQFCVGGLPFAVAPSQLLAGGSRLAQEAVGLAHLIRHTDWRAGLDQR